MTKKKTRAVSCINHPNNYKTHRLQNRHHIIGIERGFVNIDICLLSYTQFAGFMCLIRSRNCIPFASTWVHQRFLARFVLHIILVFCVVLCIFFFVLCLALCTQCCQCLSIKTRHNETHE